MADRDETLTEVADRLRINWERHFKSADILMRAINCASSGEAFYWSGIERDQVVYALARAIGAESDIACPFCGDGGFDRIGLKNHLQIFGCEVFENTPRA